MELPVIGVKTEGQEILLTLFVCSWIKDESKEKLNE